LQVSNFQGGVPMADPRPEVRPELDRRSFLKGSSAVAVGSVLAAAGLDAGSAEAAPVPPAVERKANEPGKDLKTGWMVG
jgi:anaerobic selenocysteine-containing dehydrogenase